MLFQLLFVVRCLVFPCHPPQGHEVWSRHSNTEWQPRGHLPWGDEGGGEGKSREGGARRALKRREGKSTTWALESSVTRLPAAGSVTSN